MGKKFHQHIYKMREQGVDTTNLNDIIQLDYRSQYDYENPEDVAWDDDEIHGPRPFSYLSTSTRPRLSADLWHDWETKPQER